MYDTGRRAISNTQALTRTRREESGDNMEDDE